MLLVITIFHIHSLFILVTWGHVKIHCTVSLKAAAVAIDPAANRIQLK